MSMKMEEIHGHACYTFIFIDLLCTGLVPLSCIQNSHTFTHSSSTRQKSIHCPLEYLLTLHCLEPEAKLKMNNLQLFCIDTILYSQG
jgi:hypothetical protein